MLLIANTSSVRNRTTVPELLSAEMVRFGLRGTGAIILEGDGHRTESNSFWVGRAPDLAPVERGRRLW
jgi:hypothetical protein